MKAPIPDNEAERLRTLRLYRIMNTGAEQAFDDLTSLAAAICGTPMAAISFVDETRQWFKSKIGLVNSETSRDFSFCAHAVLKDEMLIVEDATRDARFLDNPLVLQDPSIRFYAGAPLQMANGEALGALCVIDTQPRQLTDQQRLALSVLRRAVVSQLELRRALADLRDAGRLLSICAWCRKVRDDEGGWHPLHDYVNETVQVTHGLCPGCAGKVQESWEA